IKAGARVIDLGTGSGVIPLLLSVKQPDSTFVGLELIEEMAAMAARSVTMNGLDDRISIIHGDIRSAEELFGKASFDVAVSNPPYYKTGAGRRNMDPLFAVARSEQCCTLAQLLDAAAALLKPGGDLYMVYRAQRSGELFGELASRRLCLEKLRFVQPYEGRPANLMLIKARKHGRGQTKVLPPLIVYKAAGEYSEEMERIYGRDPLSGGNAHR
ncbi:MAG: methyltransferase, partial [Firmicutes bacterium]|nr:methyltransferase [Bacillota bacterium]